MGDEYAVLKRRERVATTVIPTKKLMVTFVRPKSYNHVTRLNNDCPGPCSSFPNETWERETSDERHLKKGAGPNNWEKRRKLKSVRPTFRCESALLRIWTQGQIETPQPFLIRPVDLVNSSIGSIGIGHERAKAAARLICSAPGRMSEERKKIIASLLPASSD